MLCHLIRLYSAFYGNISFFCVSVYVSAKLSFLPDPFVPKKGPSYVIYHWEKATNLEKKYPNMRSVTSSDLEQDSTQHAFTGTAVGLPSVLYWAHLWNYYTCS